MIEQSRLTVGSRGSKLSVAQTTLVMDALMSRHPGLVAVHKPITTAGDINQAPIPPGAMGKSWFTAEIEQALMDGSIDLAVHSLKDMPAQSPEGLVTFYVLKRGDPRDVLISKSGKTLADLPAGSVIGTDSVRRRSLLLSKRPDLVIKSIRGNVDTRIRKMHDNKSPEVEYDSIMLAAAGLTRLGMIDIATEIFDAVDFLPSPGQGILAVQVRADRHDVVAMVETIVDKETSIEAQAELAFSAGIGGGCKTPIGCFAKIEGEKIAICALKGDLSSANVTRREVGGNAKDALELARELASQFV